jgi:photosystem II stability/assembly factor-like uncharacterized protein
MDLDIFNILFHKQNRAAAFSTLAGTAPAAGPATSRGGLRGASPWDQLPFAEHPRRGRLVGDRVASRRDMRRRRLFLLSRHFLGGVALMGSRR